MRPKDKTAVDSGPPFWECLTLGFTPHFLTLAMVR